MRRDGVPAMVQPETAGPLLLSSLAPVLRPSGAPRLRLPEEAPARPGGGARVLALLLLALLVVLLAAAAAEATGI